MIGDLVIVNHNIADVACTNAARAARIQTDSNLRTTDAGLTAKLIHPKHYPRFKF
jgi:hypothetical protein